jgi:hypothetical protein
MSKPPCAPTGSALNLHIRASLCIRHAPIVPLNGSRCAKSGKLVPGKPVPVCYRPTAGTETAECGNSGARALQAN